MADQKTILVVDDDQELSDGLRAVLERQGYRVLQARNGQQGKQMIYNQRPHLVILDMMMPGMGGYPVLEHFRDKKEAPPLSHRRIVERAPRRRGRAGGGWPAASRAGRSSPQKPRPPATRNARRSSAPRMQS